eukprot:m.14415 g.14415  ORF g.14415 m.14415 type:complete len:50 (+) comp5080_c0_seq1:2445-2594(+)
MNKRTTQSKCQNFVFSEEKKKQNVDEAHNTRALTLFDIYFLILHPVVSR